MDWKLRLARTVLNVVTKIKVRACVHSITIRCVRFLLCSNLVNNKNKGKFVFGIKSAGLYVYCMMIVVLLLLMMMSSSDFIQNEHEQILIDIPNFKFHENLFPAPQVVTYGWTAGETDRLTDMMKLIGAICNVSL
jgi:hypothetical protein